MRLWRWLWPAPWTLFGFVLGALLLAGGARARQQAGVIEIADGALAAWASRHMLFGTVAVTLGHVILARDAATLEALREHEREHVRQYERWGPFFVPAYLADGAWQWLRGRHPYRDNRFERAARIGETVDA